MKASDSFQAGAARIDITPPAGHVVHSGDKIAEGVGDPLFAKALVFDDGETCAALLTADLILLEEDVAGDVRQRIAARTPIPAAHVLFAASHTHVGPATTRWLSPQMSDDYMADLRARLAAVVIEAWQARRPARAGTGMGEVKAAVNRWVELAAGEGARWGVNWQGPTDNSVNVLRLDGADGEPFAAMVNFAAHATVVNFGANRLYTGDYPSAVQATLETQYPGLTALFTNGASGDLKIAFTNAEGTRFAYGDLADARRYGALIGEEAAQVVAATATQSVSRLQVASSWVDLPLLPPPTEAQLRQELAQPEYPPWGEQWARAMLAALERGPLPASVRAEVQVLRLGEVAALIALPGEPFVEIGLRLKRALADQPTPFVVGYANGYCGYLPSARSVRHDGPHLRYNWHKVVGDRFPAGYSAAMEDALCAAAQELVRAWP